MTEFGLLVAFLIVGLHTYFYAAVRLNILDRPNDRSSHKLPTIRGGGIIFLMGLLFWFFVHDFFFPYLMAGAFLIALMSFMDDLKTQSALLRLVVHFLAFSLMVWELSFVLSEPWWTVLVIYLVGIGTVNSFNFMDGINGMTGCYALVVLLSLLTIDQQIINFTKHSLILALVISVGIFLFYNFRKAARCFAGDVGSITLAFLVVFFVIDLMFTSDDYGWFMLLAVYGVDSVGTIIYRLMKRENIFKAHRSHLYQYLVNEMGYSHLQISTTYALLQLLINGLVICFLSKPSLMEGLVLTFVLMFIYICVREWLMSRIGERGIISNMFNNYK